MKRKRIYAHRTLKMREDFLSWLGKKNARQQQEAEQQAARAGLPTSPTSAGPIDDGVRKP